MYAAVVRYDPPNNGCGYDSLRYPEAVEEWLRTKKWAIEREKKKDYEHYTKEVATRII